MKRKALLIGNSRGLTGVQIDLDNFESFLHSNEGGAWNLDEITVLPNATNKQLNLAIESIRESQADYCIVYFSGHGGFERQTILELADESLINENELHHLSTRQLTIFDCCRYQEERVIFESANASLESFEISDSNREYYRKKYDERILKAIPQQARLYSCSIGEISNDTPEGGIYTKALLELKGITQTVGEAHSKAVEIVNSSWNIFQEKREDKQNPDAILPKCFTFQQLIISQEV